MNRFTLGERVFPSVRRFLPTVLCRLSEDRCATKVHPSEKGFTLVTFGQDMSVRRNKGFTLLESMVVLAILGIVAAFAYPAMQTMQAGSRVRAAATDIAGVIADARAQAVGRQRSLTLTANGGEWKQGWTLAFTTPIAGVGDLASHRGLADSVAITLNPDLDALVFLPNGMVQRDDGNPIASVLFRVCDADSISETGHDVTLSRLGRTLTRKHADAGVCN